MKIRGWLFSLFPTHLDHNNNKQDDGLAKQFKIPNPTLLFELKKNICN